jgi:hypothetical protein
MRPELEEALQFGVNYLKIKDKPTVVFYHGIDIRFHELVHCKQYEVGWLKQNKEDETIFYWKNKNTKGKGYKIKEWKHYWNSPHERQARDVAKNMLKDFTTERIDA